MEKLKEIEKRERKRMNKYILCECEADVENLLGKLHLKSSCFLLDTVY